MAEKDEVKTVQAKPVTGAAAGSSAPAAPRKSTEPDKDELATGELAVDAEDPDIDPRLDNRTGSQRPKLEEFPAKPQQVNGPELGEEKAVTAKRTRSEVNGPRKGAKSPGPHGLGDTGDQI